MLKGKTIILGVTGSIAAYKAASLACGDFGSGKMPEPEELFRRICLTLGSITE